MGPFQNRGLDELWLAARSALRCASMLDFDSGVRYRYAGQHTMSGTSAWRKRNEPMSQEHAEITEEMIADIRARIGVDWRPREPYFNVEATQDTIRHFAHGIGDDNPLWCDPAYAMTTSYGCVLAPPSLLYSVYWCSGCIGMPGSHAWHSGNEWAFFRPIREGDEIQYRVQVKDLIEKQSKMARRASGEVVGDTTWIKGKVTDKSQADDKHLVDIDIWGENQRGEVTVPGRATVQWPSRQAMRQEG